MFASFMTFFGDSLVLLIIFGAVCLHYIVKFLKANPDVKNAGQQALAKKSIGWIAWLFGK